MYEWKFEQMNRRGLLLMAAAAGTTLAMPRWVSAAGKAGDREFGGDLTSVRAAIEKQRPRPSSACRTGSPCPPLRPRIAT